MKRTVKMKLSCIKLCLVIFTNLGIKNKKIKAIILNKFEFSIIFFTFFYKKMNYMFIY